MTDPLLGGHLEIETLADLDEGLLTPIETAAADEHLRMCVTCREERARLSSTRALLTALPKDPMPPDVARRIQTALQGAAATVVPLDDRPRRSWLAHPTATALVAAAAVAALVAAVVVGAFGHSKSRGTEAASSPGTTGAVAGASGGAVSTVRILATGTNYTPAQAAQQLADLLAPQERSGLANSPLSSDSAAPTPGTFAPNTAAQLPAALTKLYTNPTALEACVRALVPTPGVEPLVVDFGEFTNPTLHLKKAPALALVFSKQTGGKPDAWIVGPNCATAPDNNFYLFEANLSGG